MRVERRDPLTTPPVPRQWELVFNGDKALDHIKMISHCYQEPFESIKVVEVTAYRALEAERDELRRDMNAHAVVSELVEKRAELERANEALEVTENYAEQQYRNALSLKEIAESYRANLLKCVQAIEGVLTYDPMVDMYKLKQFFGYTLKPTQGEARAALEGEKK